MSRAEVPSLADIRRVHMVGIGGIGMSALARWLLAQGYEVSGSDLNPGEQGEALARLGARVAGGHRAENVVDPQLVVVTSAAGADNPEVREAAARGIPIFKRSQLLAAIANRGRGIAVAGTHGKTTTSALIGHILCEAGLDPTILIGGVSANLGSNARVGNSDLVVVEADEYDASFLHLRPHVAVITNVEPDHLDFYGSLDRLQAAFGQFASSVSETLVVCADDPVLAGFSSALTYGIGSGRWRATDVRDENGHVRFRVQPAGDEYTMRLAGEHNVRNALAAIVVAETLGADREAIRRGVESFRGVARRFETKGEAGGVLVMDDYAHHPTEIRVNLAALKARYREQRESSGRAVRVVFQPHTYSRTKTLLSDFATAFGDADAVYLLDIYAARERDTLGISGRDLADSVRRHHPRVMYSETQDRVIADLLLDLRPGDVVVTMGAGDVYQVGPRLLAGLRAQ